MKFKVIKDIEFGEVKYKAGKILDVSTLQSITVEDPETKNWVVLHYYAHDKQFEIIENDQEQMTLSEHLKKIKELIG